MRRYLRIFVSLVWVIGLLALLWGVITIDGARRELAANQRLQRSVEVTGEDLEPLERQEEEIRARSFQGTLAAAGGGLVVLLIPLGRWTLRAMSRRRNEAEE